MSDHSFGVVAFLKFVFERDTDILVTPSLQCRSRRVTFAPGPDSMGSGPGSPLYRLLSMPLLSKAMQRALFL